MITIQVNGSSMEVETTATLQDVLDALAIDTLGCAVAIDDNIIPRTTWASFALTSQMNINVFQAIAGG
ncbi:sulfur carrier protein ThiS [Vibrio methylphosphonaticus]|uniref:sulfur carrier protein ThiS n=1 Tax=Vibrio methylphosphonaticus TaxID=2946866 RepID=UPI00202A84D6|nr:sulfur carrier protein ThiS [Vibrio methylphosphonaticus]MCL9777385.1 sulfur carrier protein ThiS [Vibrio methylphosphonaticus]